MLISSSSYSHSTFPYSTYHNYNTYDVGTAPAMINASVQDEQAFMFDFPITDIRAVHSQSTQGHAWHRRPVQGYAEAGSYDMPNPSYTNGAMPPPSSFGTQFVSNAQPFVPYPSNWPVNGGYQYYFAPGTDHNSRFAMPQHHIVSQAQTVHPAVPGVHPPPFTSATLPSISETNAAPVVLDMIGAAGQDIDVDTTTPAIHPYSTAMPPPAPVSGTSTPASPLSDSESTPITTSPPTVRCMVDDCGQDIAVDKLVLRQHLSTSHNYPAPHRSRSVLCRWSGCLCTRPSTCRSPNLGAGHGVHIEDITDHIWTAHLSFQDVCGKCGDARWARGYSFQRHTDGCAGRKPARCVGCRQIFTSTAALVGHVELGQCAGVVDG
jgi:hypothetical protein